MNDQATDKVSEKKLNWHSIFLLMQLKLMPKYQHGYKLNIFSRKQSSSTSVPRWEKRSHLLGIMIAISKQLLTCDVTTSWWAISKPVSGRWPRFAWWECDTRCISELPTWTYTSRTQLEKRDIKLPNEASLHFVSKITRYLPFQITSLESSRFKFA